MAEDIFKQVCDAITKGAQPNVLIVLLATELKEQHAEIARLRLLMEHEETVRTKKLHRVVPVKQNSFLRGSVMKAGDRVIRTGMGEGTIQHTVKTRAYVRFDTGECKWFLMSVLRRVQKTA